MSPGEDDLRLERARRLIRSPIALPEPWELETVERAIALARRRLILPPSVEVGWRFPTPDASRGACDGHTLYFGLPGGSTRDALAEVAFHELRHLHDGHVGREFDRELWERDADAFAQEMLGYWKMGTLPTMPEPVDETDDEVNARFSSSSSTATLATCSRPTSIASSGDCRASILLDDVRRRIQRLRSRAPGHRLELSALQRAVEQLALERR